MIRVSGRARGVGLLILTLGVTACAEAELGVHLAKAVARTASEPAQPVAVAALAPERFSASGVALWDGAATLQGVWFAHPLAERAQRVRVRAEGTGREVEGALFRRDPSLAGPSIIVSSDAARALGLTAGEPENLTIVALDVTPRAPSLEPAPAAEVEVAALSAPEEEPAARGGDVEAAPEAPVAEAVDAEAPVFLAATEPAPPQLTGSSPADGSPASRSAASPQPSPRPARAAEAVPDPDPAPGAVRAPHLQVGSFAIEANARALTDRLAARGQPARMARGGGARPLSIVLIGPLATPEAVAAAREAATAEGVTDVLEVML